MQVAECPVGSALWIGQRETRNIGAAKHIDNVDLIIKFQDVRSVTTSRSVK